MKILPSIAIPTSKVVTITLNPALDLTGSLDSFNVGSVSRVEQANLHAAGKGINVAKVLSDLGADVTVTGFLGQDNLEMFHHLFEHNNISNQFVEVKGATRINVKLLEANGRVSDINFPGIEVTAQDIDRFEHKLFSLAETHDFFVLAGSLPLGVTELHCANWIQQLRKQGKRVLFDSSRAALSHGIDGQPWMVKPNNEELGELVGQCLNSPEQCQAAGQTLIDKGIEHLVVSMGENGVLWCHQGEWLKSTPPKVDLISTVGAGDTLVAGFCWGHMQLMPKYELLRFATALSALAVSQIGVGLVDHNDLKSAQGNTIITSLP